MVEKRCIKLGIIVAVALAFVLTFFYGVYRPESNRTHHSYAYVDGHVLHRNFTLDDLQRHEYLEDVDVVVFLHMQKTGGTSFGKHLVKDVWEKPCKKIKGRKRYDCRDKDKHIWLLSRYSTGWICGLHADWSALKLCVEDKMDKLERKHRHRRYHFITMLRDPVRRYISEWKHVQRGATWKRSKIFCGKKKYDMPKCYDGVDWSGVTLEEFLACPHNMGNNRQVRMLANLSKAGCNSTSSHHSPHQRDLILLESAKENLKNFSYFGLTEYQKESQYLFEKTFNLEFRRDFIQLNVTKTTYVRVSDEERKRIAKINSLDVHLYNFAKSLFLQRHDFMKGQESKLRNGQVIHSDSIIEGEQ